jgi:hypothetical protein
LEGWCGCALDGGGAGELLDLAVAAGPSPEAVALLVRVGGMDEVCQSDRVRLVGLWDELGRWCQAQAGLVLAAGCVEADERGQEEGLSPARSLVAEAALACGRTMQSARELARVGRAGLAEPSLGEALAGGRVAIGTAAVIVRAAGRLEDAGGRRDVLSLGLRLAGANQTRPRVQEACERLAASLDPAGFSGGHEAAYRERSVRYRPRAAGMGVLTLYGSAAELAAVLDKAEELAMRAGPDDPRTPDQRRYDALVAHITGAGPDAAESGGEGPGKGHSPYQVLVRLDATTLLGLDDQPGLILGAGPIPAEVGRKIAADATWRGLFTDPATGRPVWTTEKAFKAGLVLMPEARPGPPVNPWGEPADWPMEAASNGSYKPGVRLRRLLAVRQPRCANPACQQPARRCEIDHIDPFDPARPAAEQTITSNMQHLCKACHDLKTSHSWEYQRDPQTGDTTITTPHGLTRRIPADTLD